MFEVVSPKFLFISCIWVLFTMLFLRAILHQKLISRQAQLIWQIFFFCCLAFSFWGQDSEQLLDNYLGLHHSSVIVKYIALIIVSHLFYLLLEDVKPNHSLLPIKYMAMFALLFGITAFVLLTVYAALSADQLRYLFIAARDVIVSSYIILSFIPGVRQLYRDEINRMMRLKLIWILLLCGCFLITAVGSIVALIYSLLNFGNPAIPALFAQPFVVSGMLLFMLLMIPYRWLTVLSYIPQFYTYYRLQLLEQQIFRHLDIAVTNSSKQLQFHDADKLELLIYRKIISILDHYPLLSKSMSNNRLYSDLKSCEEDNPSYDQLIQRFARL